MFINRSYKYKYRLTLIALGVLFVFIYMLNIRKTIALHRDYKTSEHELALSRNTASASKKLERRLNELNEVLGSKYECSELPEEIIRFTNKLSKNKSLILVDISETRTDENENMAVCSLTVSLSGPYNDLLKYIYRLETQHKIGRIGSIDFQVKKQKQSRKEELIVQIHIQNVEIN